MAISTVNVDFSAILQNAAQATGLLRVRLSQVGTVEDSETGDTVILPIAWQETTLTDGAATLALVPNKIIEPSCTYYEIQLKSVPDCPKACAKLLLSGIMYVPDEDCNVLDLLISPPSPETANTASGYASQAKQAAQVAENFAIQAGDRYDDVAEAAATALTDIGTAKQDALDAISTAQSGATEAISTAQGTAIGAVQAEGNTQVGRVEDAGEDAVADVTAAQDAAVSAVQAQQATSVAAVTAEGTRQTELVTAEGTAQVNAVTQAGNGFVSTMQGLVSDAQAARDAAQTAQGLAEDAQAAAESASTDAQGYAGDASTSAGQAAQSASNAADSATAAQASADSIAASAAQIQGNTAAIAAIGETLACDYAKSTSAASAVTSTVPAGVNAYAEINNIGGASVIVDGAIVNAEVTQVISKTSANAVTDTRSIPRAVLALPDYGAGVGTAVNVLRLDTLQYTWAAATIDLGNLEWKLGSGWGDGGFYSDSIPARTKHVANNDTVANILCAAYPTSTRNRVQTSEPETLGIAIDTAGDICIRDTNYTTAAEITEALKGVILLFELGTAATLDVSDILPKNNVIKVSAGGSLTFDNEAGLAVPVSVTYQSGEWGLENCLAGATASLPDRDEMSVLYQQHEANTQAIASHTSALGILAKKDYAMFADWNEIAEIVKGGDAAKVFAVGDQINVPWQSGGTTKYDYSVPLDIVSFREVELEDGNKVPGMILQWHYTTGPEYMPFDQTEALYYCEEELPAGTYHVTAAVNWGPHGITAGTSFQFTTTQAVPAGGQVVFSTAMADTDIANWKAYTYASGSSITPIETIASITVGSEGTYLGSWALNTSVLSESNVNQMQRSGYGYGRWSQSLYRQWLRSADAAGAWYVQQNRFDRISAECNAQRGFMAGFNSDFLSVLNPVKVVTALNTVTDSALGATETTYDTFWLPSLEEMYFAPQLEGVEGDAWEYWKERVGMPQPFPTSKINRVYIPYGIDGTTTSRGARLRSASRGNAGTTWYVGGAGGAYYNSAYTASRGAPACAIC